MHLIISRGLYDHQGVQYVDNSFAVGKFAGLNADAEGLPVRWTFDGPAGAGFSDHFPVAATFKAVPDGRRDRWLALKNASEGGVTGDAVKTIDYAKMDLAGRALRPDALPAGTRLQQDEFKGRLVRVEGRVAAGSRLAVELRGETFDVWVPDETLRGRLRSEFREGAPMRFFGELGQYRGRWQFVIEHESWVK